MGRQATSSETSQFIHVRFSGSYRHHIGNKLLPPSSDHDPVHCGMLPQYGFDLAGFNPEPPDFQLEVHAPEIFQCAIFAPTYPVTRTIHYGPGMAGKRIGTKTFLCQFWSVEISSPNPCTTHIQLSRHAHGNRPTPLIQNIGTAICKWPPDG